MDNGEAKKRATEALDKLQLTDANTKKCMGIMLLGMKIVHWGAARMSAHVRSKLETQKEQEAFVELAMARMRDLSMREGFHSESLMNGIRTLGEILEGDIAAEKKEQEERREHELQLGIPTPFESLNRAMDGGIKAGRVVMVHGESSPVFTTLAGMYKHFLAHKVPITHFGTAKEADMPDVPGVKNVPGAFWKGQGSSLGRAKEAIGVADGYIAVVDRLDWLADPKDHKSEHKRLQLALKNLAKVAKRFKIGIVVGHVTTGEIPSVQGVHRVHVCTRRVNKEFVFMADDEMFVEDQDGRLRILGGKDDAPPRLGNPDGGTEGSEQLEGSEEDRGEETGVESDGGREES